MHLSIFSSNFSINLVQSINLLSNLRNLQYKEFRSFLFSSYSLQSNLSFFVFCIRQSRTLVLFLWKTPICLQYLPRIKIPSWKKCLTFFRRRWKRRSRSSSSSSCLLKVTKKRKTEKYYYFFKIIDERISNHFESVIISFSVNVVLIRLWHLRYMSPYSL